MILQLIQQPVKVKTESTSSLNEWIDSGPYRI